MNRSTWRSSGRGALSGPITPIARWSRCTWSQSSDTARCSTDD